MLKLTYTFDLLRQWHSSKFGVYKIYEKLCIDSIFPYTFHTLLVILLCNFVIMVQTPKSTSRRCSTKFPLHRCIAWRSYGGYKVKSKFIFPVISASALPWSTYKMQMNHWNEISVYEALTLFNEGWTRKVSYLQWKTSILILELIALLLYLWDLHVLLKLVQLKSELNFPKLKWRRKLKSESITYQSGGF